MAVKRRVLRREIDLAEKYLAGGSIFSAAAELGGLLAAGVPTAAVQPLLSTVPLEQLRTECADKVSSLERLTANAHPLLYEELMLVMTIRIELAMAIMAHNVVAAVPMATAVPCDVDIRELARRQLYRSVMAGIRRRWQSEIPFDLAILGIEWLTT